ncbi:hypothetical protein SmJEL517_g00553 [Synchytrium microbalum]|uniref:Aldehyde dehydrogenase domain-containing protein n=1 Tax=Synchytrium microbalum TaxID=1806994 RepID=A0A507CHY6_9FUNG|nr:uncharacterized protein SmJEL517_g00553 [Synchytrium microbalum]TPX37684.1 hypothetical protein SmJEL517_g00553 [Synchytrium microbalum]
MAALFNTDLHAKITHRSGKVYNVPTGLFIGNKYVKSVSGKKFASVDPHDGKVIVDFFEADKADLLTHIGDAFPTTDVAVKVAQEAYENVWCKVTPSERARLMNKLADLMERDTEVLAELESMDNGKTVKDARTIDVPGAIASIRYYAGWADKITGKVADINPNLQTYTRHEALGVVGQIIPWNFPLLMMAWKYGPALACGNCLVMKTSEKTPMSGLYLTQLVVEAGFPPGVINVLSGYGATAGNAIASHMDISKVAFTGSTAVGRKIMAAAAGSNLKKVSLELGGKSPNIVFEDADLDKAAFWASLGIFMNHGQVCCAGSRLFVQSSIYDKFIEKLTAVAQAINVADPFDDKSNHGPLVDEIQFNRVMNYIDMGKKAGAKVAFGGNRVGTEGYYVAPTLLTDVTDDTVTTKDEIFGPVLSALKFDTIEEVIKRANNTSFGLAAAVHTKSLNTAMRVSNALKAGTVWVNCYNMLTPQQPFGGYKESGIGRELGEYGLMEYYQIKSVCIMLD